MEKIVEVLVYDRTRSNEDFETFLLKLVERLKALRYCSRLVVKIVRGMGELQVELENLSSLQQSNVNVNGKTTRTM